MSIPSPTTDQDRVYGIVNPFGELWTWNTFERAEDAEQHLRDFWGKDAAEMVPQFKLCAVRVDVTPESEPFALPSAQGMAGEAPRREGGSAPSGAPSPVNEVDAPKGSSK